MEKKHKKNNNRNYNKKKVTPKTKNKNSKKSKNEVKSNNKNQKNIKKQNNNKSQNNNKNQNKNSIKQQNFNKDIVKPLNNTNNKNNTVESINNYDLNKKLILEESKKNDLEKIFDANKNNLVKEKSNVYKELIVVLFLIIIVLTGILLLTINDQGHNKSKIDECLVKNSQDNNKDDDVTNKDPKEETYLFLGDSIFYQYNTGDHFRDYNTINTGVNGITALQTIERVDEGVYQYNPTTIFILLGTNDLYHGYTSEETFEHLTQLIDKIHSDRPEITINVLSILPINKSDNPKVSQEANINKTNEQINEVNKNLRQYCEDNDFTYINVHDLLLDENGELNLAYTYEGLHITELGYHHITMELLKYIEK